MDAPEFLLGQAEAEIEMPLPQGLGSPGKYEDVNREAKSKNLFDYNSLKCGNCIGDSILLCKHLRRSCLQNKY
jgi:hypothetical protein